VKPRIAIAGAGLSGLAAACFAAAHGASVTLAAFGEGGIALGHGAFELWASSTPSRSIRRLPETHPYRLAGDQALRSGLSELQDILSESGLDYAGGISSNRELLSAAGMFRQVAFAPPGAALRDALQDSPAALAVLPGLRDYFPDMIARNASRLGIRLDPQIELPLIGVPRERSFYALDLARRFEQPSWLQEILRAWRPKLVGVKRLVLPACLGLRQAAHVREELESELGLRCFEIPLPPPTVPGLRLQLAMRDALARLQVDFILGARAVGRYDARSGGTRSAGFVLETAGGTQAVDADAVILATGGVLHGGLRAPQNGPLHEPVFQILVTDGENRALRTGHSPFSPQPYAQAGVQVDASMRALGPDSSPFLENVFAAGGLLAGSDRTSEGSRQGIDIASAYKAAQSALELCGLPFDGARRHSKSEHAS